MYLCAASTAASTGAPRDVPWWRPRSTRQDRKSTRLNSSHQIISYAVFCLKKKKKAKPFSLVTQIIQNKNTAIAVVLGRLFRRLVMMLAFALHVSPMARSPMLLTNVDILLH